MRCYSMVFFLTLLLGLSNSFFSCTKKNENESSLPTNTFHDWDQDIQVPNTSEQKQSSDSFVSTAGASRNASASEAGSVSSAETTPLEEDTGLAFPEGFSNFVSWNGARFAQKNASIEFVGGGELYTFLSHETLSPENTVFTPIDTYIGPLENVRSTPNALTQKIVQIIESFISHIQTQTLDDNIKKFVIKDAIVVVQRQLAVASDYVPGIRDVRIGTIIPARENQSERFAKLRLLGEHEGKDTQALLQVYFVQEEGVWKIATIEGSFDDLQRPYQKKGAFVPSGTAGFSQTY